MEVVASPETVLPLFDQMQSLCSRIEGRAIAVKPLERFAFYAAAKQGFAVVRTSDAGPYGCFILKKCQSARNLGPLSAPNFDPPWCS